MSVRILQGDCREVLKSLPDASVDSIVTDPPYDLTSGKKGGTGVASVNLDSPYGRSRIGTGNRSGGFMGMAWDGTGVAFDPETWRQCLRVLKPGGHLLAFGGTRTYHRMACAIEDAGFEIRDQIGWAYGSGFPKSLDVSNAIDKARTEDLAPLRVVCRGVRAAMDRRGLKSRDLVKHFGDCDPRLVDHWAARDTDSQPSLPTWSQWETLRGLFPEIAALDTEAWRLNGRKGRPGDAWAEAEILGHHEGKTPGFTGLRFSVVDNTIREPSEAARNWKGWGTALKPAWEPVCMARKALIGTVAANVLAHGTGALNIDGCRVPGSKPDTTRGASSKASSMAGPLGAQGRILDDGLGRWPANLIHDGSDGVVALFPQSAGQLADASTGDSPKTGRVYGAMRREGEPSADSENKGAIGFKMRPGARRLDAGSAARFFYCAKASRTDRDEGLEGMPQSRTGGMKATADGSMLTGSGNERTTVRANTHPTVKPTDLMRYLCRLVTPPGGTVLDPFMGSGSTGKAAELDGFSFIGVELNPEYIEIARRRIAADAPLFAEVEAPSGYAVS